MPAFPMLLPFIGNGLPAPRLTRIWLLLGNAAAPNPDCPARLQNSRLRIAWTPQPVVNTHPSAGFENSFRVLWSQHCT
ncbi:hypothetical protein M8818_003147 [Zalaria obscura]|uniref:Uncharacterized protein n=1 Tax=Zalaria obscura TaxID=2024903 RepID=A0ACC3SF68_9PEZI